MHRIEIGPVTVHALDGNCETNCVIISGDRERPPFFDAFDRTKASLFSVSCPDWNACLSPWPVDACFKGGKAFAGKAEEYLSVLTKTVLPEAEAYFHIKPQRRMIMGYSLAGLFSLYAFLETGLFTHAASVSGSLWFDGFIDYLSEKTPPDICRGVYLSLGDREPNTKNERLRTVGSATERACLILKDKNLNVRYELNPGNHFQACDARMLRALNALI